MDDLKETTLFKVVDYAIFGALITVSIIIGLVVGFKEWRNASTSDFLVGGRNMHPIPVAMSLIGGVISALSVIGNATEMYLYGSQLTLNMIGSIYGTLIVVILILPVLYPLELLSMMQYLEMRFNSKILRKLGSLNKIINICLYMGICLYAPALALASVTDFSTWNSIVVLGIICTFYISIGGVKAVVYTDVFQTTIMFIGVLTVVSVVSLELGGIASVFSIADKGGRLEFFNFDPSPFVRHTFWSVQIHGMYFVVTVLGLSQPQFQRLISVKSLKLSQGLCVMFLIGLTFLWGLFYYSGIVAYAVYADCDPLASNKIKKADQIVPYMIADKLHNMPGMAGLFVAAVYGAVLSSISSAASSVAAMIWDDFLKPWAWFQKNIGLSSINVTRLLTLFAGLLGIAFAFVVGSLGTIFQVTYSIIGAIIGPLNGLFITGIAAPWVNKTGAVSGFIVSFLFNTWVAVGQFVYKAGKSELLPLSTSGCSPEVFNTSLSGSDTIGLMDINDDLTTPMSFIEQSAQPLQETSDHLFIYNISYCYFGLIGTLIVFFVGSIVSFITGPVHPNDVDPKLVYGFSLKLYKRICKKSEAEKSRKPISSSVKPSSKLQQQPTPSLEIDRVNLDVYKNNLNV